VSDASQNIPAVIRAVAEAGYEARPVEAAAHDHGEHHQSRWQWNLLLGVFVTAFLMIGEWVFDRGLKPWFQWLSFALAGAVIGDSCISVLLSLVATPVAYCILRSFRKAGPPK